MLFEDGLGFCPWHKRDSSFKQVFYQRYSSPVYYNTSPQSQMYSPPRIPMTTGILVMECLHCSKSVILLETRVRLPKGADGEPEKENVWRSMVSPHETPRSLHESAPDAVRSLFAEASTCEKSKAFRAAGVMYRAAVEELVKEQNATGKDLWNKIESLKGTLPDELVRDLHEARMLGNDSIHSGITYSREEVEDVAELIEEAVLVLYVQPEEKRAMREARKARRDGAASASSSSGSPEDIAAATTQLQI